ncbi:polysaccharide deacetylase family protein [Neobacillus niacini]|uniref:polysaccharide deacetylase family protein n=1 Tax=Neobacillus niacini TaxID=86668 RepID=UPI0021CAE539|nr:polysaccharide deacetylase family protein [Neobacillus niacini]MCM3765816.1 polysaccharide deacetylase [Neobacillus niacini]
MGKLKQRRQVKGVIALAVTIVVLFTAVLVTNYFKANAAEETTNHKNNENIKKAVAANYLNEKPEKELHRKHQEKAMASSRESTDTTSSDIAATPPASNATASQTTPTEPNANQTQPDGAQSAINNKTVFLTFDDGPASFSGEIVTLLEQYNAKATFFMIDGNIRRYPEAVKLMVDSGHAVGLHSVSHNKNAFYASANSVLGELNQNRNTLLEISGIDSHLMRTPYGSAPYMTDEYKAAVAANGYLMWDWNIDSKDWYYKDERYVNSVIEQMNAKANHSGPFVILLHERKETLAHLPKLLDYLKQQGFELKAIDSSMVPVQF